MYGSGALFVLIVDEISLFNVKCIFSFTPRVVISVFISILIFSYELN